MATQTKSHSHSHSHSSSTSSSSSQSSKSSSPSSSQKQYYLITNVNAPPSPEIAEIDLRASSWKLPYSIDDSDLCFDGKPLNLLYEENLKGLMMEHGSEPKSRGRSRQSKK